MPAAALKRPLAALAALAVIGTLSACGDDEPDRGTDASDASSSTSESPTAEAGACEYVPDGTEDAPELPAGDPAVSGQVQVSIATSAGDLSATLDADAAPCTVNSFVSLAEQGYFDDTPCHRLTTAGIHVLQCGDPTGSGMGGPGYSFADEVTGDETYPAGTLAMANAGPDTNGSQFFIVYQDAKGALAPNYTEFGTISKKSLAEVRAVAKEGVEGGGNDGPPATPVEISSVTVE